MLDAAAFRLLRESQTVKLERLPLELLLLLVERHGELESRAEISTRLWSDANEVDVESGIHTAMRKLRAALQHPAERPAFIETVPGKGYGFVAPVSQALTIAVPPFENLGGNAAHEHLAHGLTEETSGARGTIAPENIRVSSRARRAWCTSTRVRRPSRSAASSASGISSKAASAGTASACA